MAWTTALRLERVRLAAEATRRLVDLEGRRHGSVLAVGLVVLAAAVLAAATAQLPTVASAAGVVAGGAVVALQLRELRRLAEEDWSTSMVAVASISRLIRDLERPEGEERLTPGDLDEDLRPSVELADRLLHRRLLLPNP